MLHIKQRLQTGNVYAKKHAKKRSERRESIEGKQYVGFDVVWCLMHIASFSLLDERDGGAGREGDEETDNMKASLDSGGFNLLQKAHPQTRINASWCECHSLFYLL